MGIKEKLLNIKDKRPKLVEVLNWDEQPIHIYVKKWSTSEYMNLCGAWQERDNLAQNVKAQAHVVAVSVCDEDGNRVFEDSDVAAILDKSQKAIAEIAVEAMKHNGIDLTVKDEDLKKKSSNSQHCASPCDSPPTTESPPPN